MGIVVLVDAGRDAEDMAERMTNRVGYMMRDLREDGGGGELNERESE